MKGSDKVRFQTLDDLAQNGGGGGGVLAGEHVMVEPWLLGLVRAKPEMTTGSHIHMDPPPVGNTIKVRYNACWAAGKGGSLSSVRVAL